MNIADHLTRSTTTKEKTNLSVPLDPTHYPSNPSVSLDITKHTYNPINRGELFCHLLSDIFYFWLEPTNLRIDRSIQLSDQEFPNLRTWFKPPYLAPKRLDVRNVAYVLMDFVTWLLGSEQEWGFGYWVRVYEETKGAEQRNLLLDLYVAHSRRIDAMISNGTVLDDTTVTVSDSLIMAVKYTGTVLTQSTIFRVFWSALIRVVGHDATAPCGRGTGQVFTPDGSAKIVMNVIDSGSGVGSYTNTDLVRGIMHVLLFYVRENRWESSISTIKYNRNPFLTLSVEKGPERIPGSGSGFTDFGSETATS